MAALVDPFDTAAPAAAQTPARATPVAAGGLDDPFDYAQPTPPATQPPPMPQRRPPFLTDSIQNRAAELYGTAKGIGAGAVDSVTGASRREFDFPEIWSAMSMENPPRGAGNYAAYPQGLGLLALGRDDRQKAGIWERLNPDSPARFDKFGNAIVKFGGQDFYLNSPGVSGQDFRDMVVQGLGMPLAMKGAQIGKSLLGALGRVAGAGAGFSLGGSLQDEAALAAGAPEGATPGRAGVDFALGSAGELIAPAFGPVAAQAMKRPATAFVDAVGAPTQETIKIFVQAGIDPKNVTSAMVNEFARDARLAADPVAAARYAAARSLPVPVPMTRGQISLNASDQMTEDLMLKGAMGQGAENTMRSQRLAEQQALHGNAEAIQKQVAGGTPTVTTQGQGAATAQAKMSAMEQAQHRAASAAYDKARAADQAWIPASETQRIAADMLGAVEKDHALAVVPNAAKLHEEFAKLAADGNPQTIVDKMFTWRRQATNATPADEGERVAIKKMITSLDKNLDDLVTSDLLRGNAEAIPLWKKAISGWKEFRDKWDNPDLMGKLVERQTIAGKSELKVAPESAANLIFGTANMGLTSRPEIARQLIRMRDTLGAKSPEWNALREEAWLRFVRQAEGPMEGGVLQFSGAKFKTAWHDANMRNAPLMQVLFNTEERNLITQFADVAARVTNPVKGGQNFSNTTPAAANIIGKVFDKLLSSDGGKSYLSLLLPSGVIGRVQQVRAFGATGATPAAVRPSPGSLGSGGAMILENTNQ